MLWDIDWKNIRFRIDAKRRYWIGWRLEVDEGKRGMSFRSASLVFWLYFRERCFAE